MRQYHYKAPPKFWRNYNKLHPAQKASAKAVWQIFKCDPFDPRLRTHRIHMLSAALGQTVYAVEVESNLRVVFYLTGAIVVTLDIGTHDIYR